MHVTELTLRQKQRFLDIRFDNGHTASISCEQLRIHSPSAEVQGHGGKGGTVPQHKENVNIIAMEPVGHYAIKLIFDDGHQSGLYTWDYLYQLSQSCPNNQG